MEPKRHPGPLSFAMALLLTISPLIRGVYTSRSRRAS